MQTPIRSLPWGVSLLRYAALCLMLACCSRDSDLQNTGAGTETTTTGRAGEGGAPGGSGHGETITGEGGASSVGGGGGRDTASASESGTVGGGTSGVGGADAISSGGSAAGGGGEGGASDDGPLFTEAPTFVGNTNAAAPQVGIVSFETDEPSSASIMVSGGGETWTLANDAPSLAHRQVVLGVKPDTDYTAVVTVSTDTGATRAEPVHWHSPPLPETFPEIELITSDPERMEPGMTLLDVRSLGYLVVLDENADVRWHYLTNSPTGHVVLRNGNILFTPEPTIIELDWLGETVQKWGGAFHHSVHEMPSGNVLALIQEGRTIDDYPTSATDPDAPTATAQVVGDILVEFTRVGNTVKEIPLLDVLDPRRPTHFSVESGTNKDWSHANSAVYDEADDAYIVSVRHQDAVIKIDRATGSLVWILGNHANWGSAWASKLLTPAGDLTWQFQQHSANLTPDGIIVYDNGNVRAPAFEPKPSDSYSRAVRFAIDESTRTVREVWSHIPVLDGSNVACQAMGDADLLPMTNNVLITSGTVKGRSVQLSHLVEVTETGEPVFELVVVTPNRFTTFNSQRVGDIRYHEFTPATRNSWTFP